jgi:uncharacterized spore protein YtfJ
MATTSEQVDEMRDQVDVESPVDRIIERLADSLGAKARVDAVFGEPIRQGDMTIVPVARVRWGFGGGGGTSEAPGDEPASGSGAGGGVLADPAGHLEIGPMGATFRPIPVRPSPALILASGITAALLLRALARLLGR